jgi:phenylacetate-CoA ligase
VTRLRSAVATRLLDPLGWKVKGIDVGKRLKEFRSGQWDDPDVWKARRGRLLSNLLAHAVTRVPYYRARIHEITPDSIAADPLGSLRSFPILEREDLLDCFDELVCEMGRGSWLDASGGSTGTPARFLHDKHYHAAALATTQLSFDWAGVGRSDRRVSLWAARADFVGRHSPMRRAADFLYDRATLDAFHMGEKEMSMYVRFLNRRPPACIDGYSDAIFHLAEFARRESLDVPSPRAVATGASTLHAHMRATIGEVFRAPVFDRYGTREAGLAAAECNRHCGLHVMGETAVVEIVDDDGREVDEGHVGQVVATNLWNYTMPLIRYRIGDRAVRGPDLCGCGRPYPLIDRIVGRTGACFARPDGGLVLAGFFIRLLGVEFNTGDIKKYQFVQEALDSVTVRIAPLPGRPGPDQTTRSEIAERICDAMGAPCRVEFSIEDDIPPSASGKHTYSVSKVG